MSCKTDNPCGKVFRFPTQNSPAWAAVSPDLHSLCVSREEWWVRCVRASATSVNMGPPDQVLTLCSPHPLQIPHVPADTHTSSWTVQKHACFRCLRPGWRVGRGGEGWRVVWVSLVTFPVSPPVCQQHFSHFPTALLTPCSPFNTPSPLDWGLSAS